ncbi:hypothetical protein ABWW58_08820 [Sporolactobacillus sp. STCC-11]|uniref:hypothetical protein n=1 Tax=Sporolactobacillus caesalpiniae TaxID=3230362 RepID=UPI0033930AED
MKWTEVRDLFPNQFVLISILHAQREGNKKIIDEVAPIRSVPDKEANRSFFQAKGQLFIIHTSNEKCVINSREDSLIRMIRIP